MIKKGTKFECIMDVSENNDKVVLKIGDIFYQSRDNETPVYKEHIYGSDWKPYMKIVSTPGENLSDFTIGMKVKYIAPSDHLVKQGDTARVMKLEKDDSNSEWVHTDHPGKSVWLLEHTDIVSSRKKKQKNVQYFISKKIIGHTNTGYYVYIRNILNHRHNNIFNHYVVMKNDKIYFSEKSVPDIEIKTLPTTVDKFKVIVGKWKENVWNIPKEDNGIPDKDDNDDWELPETEEEKNKKPDSSEADEWLDMETGQKEPPKPQEEEVELLDLKVKEEIKLMMPFPILLEGPVGTGKSTILIELAKELGLRYFASVLTDQTSKNEFTGYKNVMNGEMIKPEFREAVEFGGMYVLEELNGAVSNMPIIFNSIDNGYFVFADKIIDVHPDFRLCATMNTITNAKEFGGRRVLDKSVEDRFHKVMVFGDILRFHKNTIIYKKAIDKELEEAGISSGVTNRDCQRFEFMIGKGVQTEVAIKKCLIQGKIELEDKALTKIKLGGTEW